jgi:hypothetical protein
MIFCSDDFFSSDLYTNNLQVKRKVSNKVTLVHLLIRRNFFYNIFSSTYVSQRDLAESREFWILEESMESKKVLKRTICKAKLSQRIKVLQALFVVRVLLFIN